MPPTPDGVRPKPLAGLSPAGYDPGAPTTPDAGGSADPATDRRWSLLHSRWLLLPVLGGSCLGGLGFLYIGFRARRRAWWIAGIGYLALGWTALAFLDTTNPNSLLGEISATLFLHGWIACMLHGMLINSAWLRWRAAHRPA